MTDRMSGPWHGLSGAFVQFITSYGLIIKGLLLGYFLFQVVPGNTAIQHQELDAANDPRLKIFFLSQAHADSLVCLTENDFAQYEYQFQLGNIPQWDMTGRVPTEIKALLGDLNVGSKIKRYKTVYLDTINRDLKHRGLVVRVRKNIDNPTKSKLTVKSQSDRSPSAVIDLPEEGIKKREINYKGDRTNHAVSVDIVFNSDDGWHDASMLAGRVSDLLVSNAPLIYRLINPAQYQGGLLSTGVIAQYRIPIEYFAVEMELDVFVYDDGSRILELSYKGSRTDKQRLDLLAVELTAYLSSRGILSKSSESKTGKSLMRINP